MLEYNNIHDFAFAVGLYDKKYLFLEAPLAAALISPQFVRQQIDDLTAEADASTNLWKPENWKGASGAPGGGAPK